MVRNPGPGILKEKELSQGLPENYIHQRLIGDLKITPEPDEKIACQWEDKEGVAIINKIKNLMPGEEKEINVGIDIETVNLKYHLYPHRTGTLDDIPEEIKEKYLIIHMAKSTDEELKEVVRKADLLFQTGEKEIKKPGGGGFRGREKIHFI